MPGLFQGLEIGKRALLSSQVVLQTIGHNVANVNTPGYSRQRVNINTTYPEMSAHGPIGSGVSVRDVRQVRDLFLGSQYRRENKSLGQWSYKEKVMGQVEALFNEPSDNTLSDQLNDFWNSWSALATDNTGASRKALITSAVQLTNGFHQLAGELQTLRDSIDRDMVNITESVNGKAREVARLNKMISMQEAGGDRANDLRDARDLLVDEMSEFVDINTVEDERGNMIVYVGAMTIVDGPDSLPIEARSENKSGVLTHKLVWEGSSVEITNLNGQLKGLVDARDEVIPRYLNELHTLSNTIAREVNAMHRTGYGVNDSTGVDFFETDNTDAFNISVNRDLLADSNLVAAAVASGSPADNRLAVAISELQDKKVFFGNSSTMSDYYNSMVSNLGVESNEAMSFSANYELLVNQVNNSKMAVEGVSIDEEMANMVKFQHAYDAAARVITTMDQALDTIISGMGVVGR
ncbi:MAG: flagellar hook-associated protein FlgK [bacterium]|nr:flagellar hook-associated protein FlgK [bacterium]